MKDKENHYIPNPREFAQEIAEETRHLRREITNGITHIYYPFDFRRNQSLKNLSNQLHDLLEKKLWLKILLSMGLGVIMGLLLGASGDYLDPISAEIIGEWIALPGYIFLGLLKMIVVPLVFASIVLGVASQSMNTLKKTGLLTAAYFVTTTAIATAIGIGVALYIHPGQYISGELVESSLGTQVQAGPDLSFNPSALTIPSLLIGGLLPSNPFGALVSGEMLQVVIIAVIIGVALISMNKEQSTPMVSFLTSVQAVCMTVVKWSMALAPIAVFGLLTKFTMKLGIEALLGMTVYVGTVLASLLLLMCLNLVIVSFIARYNPFKFLKAIRDVMLLAFSTSSSAAVMPVSIKTAEEKLGVKPSISEFVIPLGATANMNGTALYQGVATIFLADVFGIDLGPSQLLAVMVMAVAASIGTPSIPGVGIVVLAMILNSVGIPTSGIALIMGVDRILDMSRTTVNVAGDLVTCKVMDRWVGGGSKEEVNETVKIETKVPEEKNDDKVKANTDITASKSSNV
ncbi:MAG: dicarboxylate/amino acid:cation symporter [Methanosarcina sp.]|nr:dicarboxylate/amino acid:cation symporter [Methanosarcina sp.]